MRKTYRPFVLILLIAALGACASKPREEAGYPMVSGMDYMASIPPAAPLPEKTGPSLWTTNTNSLLGLRQASEVGDILTVIVEVNDTAQMQSTLTRQRKSAESMNVNALLGLPEWANGVLPGGASLSPAVDVDRDMRSTGNGSVLRKEKITFQLAVTVIGVLPNGNLVIEGRQVTKVSQESRLLRVAGVIRPQDITRFNTIGYEKIANADISYLGKGEVNSATSSKYGTKIFDKILPF